MLTRIAHKHASLGITEDQYPIVHEHLFAAIVEVLGDAVTPEVAAAWDEVYWHMANALIAIEKDLYAGAGVADGDVWRTLVVRRRVQESPDTVSFVLALARRQPAARLPARAVRLGRGPAARRSAPDPPVQPDRRAGGERVGDHGQGRGRRPRRPRRIVPAGEVSNFLHHNVFEGDELTVSAPFGDLVLDEGDAPLVLVSAGIGVTPMLGMLRHLRRRGLDPRGPRRCTPTAPPPGTRTARSSRSWSPGCPGATLHRWYEDLGLRPDRSDVLGSAGPTSPPSTIPADAQVYLCGPLPFMESARAALLAAEVPDADIHYEVFGPDNWLATA